jgi:Protein of unknown function (DUF3617)
MCKRLSAWLLVLPLAAATAQPLNIKPGAWEMTMTSAALPKPVVEKECITKADIAEIAAEADEDDEGDCKAVAPPIVSGNQWSADKLCKNGRKVRAVFSAESPERVQGTIVSSGSKGSVTVQVSAKWLGASCAGIR